MDIRIAVALNSHQSLRPVDQVKLASAVRDQADFLRLSPLDVGSIIGRRFQGTWKPAELLTGAERLLVVAKARNIRPLVAGNQDYPHLLAQIHDPPLVLWTFGNVASLQGRLIAYVGTRRPSEYGRRAAWKFGAGIAGLGLGLVSGLAFGVDTAAHAGFVTRARDMLATGNAVSLAGPVAVFATGLGMITPRSNIGLARGIVACGGCLVSEYPVFDVAYKYRFIARNRIISGLAETLVMGECPRGSGALHTLQFALDQDREVLLHRPGDRRRDDDGLAEFEAAGARTILFAEEVVGKGSGNFSI